MIETFLFMYVRSLSPAWSADLKEQTKCFSMARKGTE